MKKDLIIVSCSARKKKLKGFVKAWDLYDGVIYRVLKKNKIDLKKYDVKIISAKYGLLNIDDKIKYYDQKMDNNRALYLKEEISKKTNKLFKKNYNSIYICLGKIYLRTIDEKLLSNKKIKITKGPIGIKMQKVKKLLQT